MSGSWSAPLCAEEHCITCGDEGISMRVVAVGADGLASCRSDDDGVLGTIDVQLVGGLAPGDLVLVHAGVALVRVAEEVRA